MDRREAMKRGAMLASSVVLPRAIMVTEKDREPGVTVLTPERLLSIYDPTLDPKATGPWRYPDGKIADYEPLGIDIDRLSAADWRADVLATGAVGKDLQSTDILLVFDGHPVRGAFEASVTDGWVRFLAHRSIVDPITGKGSTPTPYKHPNGKGLVHGIAFGRVEWWVRKGKIVKRA